MRYSIITHLILATLFLAGCGDAEPSNGAASVNPPNEQVDTSSPRAGSNDKSSVTTTRSELSHTSDSSYTPRTDSSSHLASVSDDELTFRKHIAPIVFDNCSPCHRPGEVAPFDLLGYGDIKKRADQIVDVISSRYMPPWLPEPSEFRFRGERRLSENQIDAIRRWVMAGAREGNHDDLPARPQFTQGWKLGEPDLVVTMPRKYTLPSTGKDVFRNFVIPIHTDTTKYVNAVELRPGNRRVVHHANMLVDRTPSCRLLAAEDSEVGFEGMESFGEAEIPDGNFLNWKPGTPPFAGIEGKAWRLDKGTDLVVSLHMLPSGKPEEIQARAGFYFADKPPQGHPLQMLQLENDRLIDIPPGKDDFVVRDQLTLPVDVDVYGVYPHLHYLGKSVEGVATLPDGTRKYLIHIKQWDFNWQAVYRFERPVPLPAGTVVSMRMVYDNSTANPQNPNNPPQTVTAGNSTFDEMGHLWVQILTRTKEDLENLKLAIWQHKVGKYPANATFQYNLGVVWNDHGKTREATEAFQKAVKIDPKYARAQHGLAMIYQQQGRLDQAAALFRKSLDLQPEFAEARVNYAIMLMKQRRYDEAESQLRRVLASNSDYILAHNSLGMVTAERGDLEAAQKHFETALRIHPQSAEGLFGMAVILDRQGNTSLAQTRYEDVLRLYPDFVDAMVNLGSLLANQKQYKQAAQHYQKALQLQPNNAEALNNIGLLFALTGKMEQAAKYFEDAIQANDRHPGAHVNHGTVLASQGKLSDAITHYKLAIDIDPKHAEAYNSLGAAYAQMRRFAEARDQLQKSVQLDPDNQVARQRLQAVMQILRQQP